MREKLIPEQYEIILNKKPEDRIAEKSGDLVYDKIVGILIAYSKNYDMREGWIDMITVRDAEKEIKQLIKDCGGDVSKLK